RAKQGGTLRLDAVVSATCADPVSASAQTQLLTIPELVLDAVDAEGPVRVGGTVVYVITVKNQGSGADADVRVTATLPDSMQFLKATGASDATVDGQTVTFAPVPALEPGKDLVWRIEAKALRPDDAQFRVEL